MKLPEEVDAEMGDIIQEVKAIRNAKTTSRLASNPYGKPKSTNNRYDLKTIRNRLQKTLKVLSNDVANHEILMEAEEERWCREKLLDDVANDINTGVANDIQVLELSSDVANEVSTPSPERFQKPEPDRTLIASSKGAAARQPCSQSLRADTPPAHHSAGYLAVQNTTPISALYECRSATRKSAENGFAVFTNSSRTVPILDSKPSQGAGLFDPSLNETMERLEQESRERRQWLTENASDRTDPKEENWLLKR
jgi:hypothetical protein